MRSQISMAILAIGNLVAVLVETDGILDEVEGLVREKDRAQGSSEVDGEKEHLEEQQHCAGD